MDNEVLSVVAMRIEMSFHRWEAIGESNSFTSFERELAFLVYFLALLLCCQN
jgi:hypothetical protein